MSLRAHIAPMPAPAPAVSAAAGRLQHPVARGTAAGLNSASRKQHRPRKPPRAGPAPSSPKRGHDFSRIRVFAETPPLLQRAPADPEATETAPEGSPGSECTGFRVASIERTVKAATFLVDSALDVLGELVAGPQPLHQEPPAARLFDAVFHTTPAYRSAHPYYALGVFGRFSAIRNELAASKVSWDEPGGPKYVCHETDPRLCNEPTPGGAFTPCDRGAPITLCRRFFFQDEFESARQLIHEVAHHVPDICDDHAYEHWSTFKDLTPKQTSTNPDSYAAFARDAFFNRVLLPVLLRGHAASAAEPAGAAAGTAAPQQAGTTIQRAAAPTPDEAPTTPEPEAAPEAAETTHEAAISVEQPPPEPEAAVRQDLSYRDGISPAGASFTALFSPNVVGGPTWKEGAPGPDGRRPLILTDVKISIVANAYGEMAREFDPAQCLHQHLKERLDAIAARFTEAFAAFGADTLRRRIAVRYEHRYVSSAEEAEQARQAFLESIYEEITQHVALFDQLIKIENKQHFDEGLCDVLRECPPVRLLSHDPWGGQRPPACILADDTCSRDILECERQEGQTQAGKARAFLECDPDNEKKIEIALARARRMIQVAVRDFAYDAAYHYWFGKYPEDQFNAAAFSEVSRRLRLLQDRLLYDNITFKCGRDARGCTRPDGKEFGAFTYHSRNAAITFCSKFLDYPPQVANARLLIHEAAHNVGAGLGPEHYGPPKAHALAEQASGPDATPAQVLMPIRNAENYMFYVYQSARGEQPYSG